MGNHDLFILLVIGSNLVIEVSHEDRDVLVGAAIKDLLQSVVKLVCITLFVIDLEHSTGQSSFLSS